MNAPPAGYLTDQIISPGPGAYLLPSTVGYQKHDSTRDRQPAYSMGQRQVSEFKSIGPGPVFLAEQYDRFGSTKTPAYTMAAHIKPVAPFNTPGPGTYFPENWQEKAPSFSLLQRLPTSTKFKTPAPNAYNLPSCLNGTIQHLGMRLDDVQKDCSPGPAHYPAANLNSHRWKMPQYSIAQRVPPLANRSPTPGPSAYLPEYIVHRTPPKFSFGMKHTDCKFTPFTDADKYPPGCP